MFTLIGVINSSKPSAMALSNFELTSPPQIISMVVDDRVCPARCCTSLIDAPISLLTEPKTEKSRRSIKLEEFALTILKGIKKTDGIVFQSGNGTPFSARNLLRHFHSILEEADLLSIRFHDLRYTFASLFIIKMSTQRWSRKCLVILYNQFDFRYLLSPDTGYAKRSCQ